MKIQLFPSTNLRQLNVEIKTCRTILAKGATNALSLRSVRGIDSTLNSFLMPEINLGELAQALNEINFDDELNRDFDFYLGVLSGVAALTTARKES